MQKYSKLIIFTDGGSRNNPGPAGIGYVIKDDQGNNLEAKGEHIGEATNNVAEYSALIKALHAAKKYDHESLECFLDSELVVKQITGEYRVKDENLKKLLNEVRELIFFKNVTFTHILRAKNKEADALYNKALDEAGF
jgi:ribonuclease HI